MKMNTLLPCPGNAPESRIFKNSFVPCGYPASGRNHFGALDVITRGEMQDWLLGVRARLNRTVLLVTHDMDEAIYLSDRILILDPGSGRIGSEIEIAERTGAGTGFTVRGTAPQDLQRDYGRQNVKIGENSTAEQYVTEAGRFWEEGDGLIDARSYRDRRGDPGTHSGWNPFCDMCGKPKRGGAIKTAVQSF